MIGRWLTPLGWAAILAAAVVAVVVAAGFRWDPFDLTRRRIEAAEARAAAADRDAAARRLETEGERRQTASVRVADAAVAAARTATVILQQQARTAPDAQTAISPDRLDRLWAHDDELCRAAPALAGCAAAPPAAAGGDNSLPPAAARRDGLAG